MVCLFFIPLGFVLNRYPVRADTVLKSLLGQSYVYNAEWWYIGHYVRFMLLFPIVAYVFAWLDGKNERLFHLMMLFGLVVLLLAPEEASWLSFYLVFYYFLEGMYFARSTWFEIGYRMLRKDWGRLLIGMGLIVAVFVLRTLGTADYWLVPFLVFGFVLLIKHPIVSGSAGRIFLFVGKYSTYIWLTHTFFGYYYFQKLTYLPKYSWLVAIWCMLLCIASGAVLERIRLFLSNAAVKCGDNASGHGR